MSSSRDIRTFREWLDEVNVRCMRRWGFDLYHLRIRIPIGLAYERGDTPDEFIRVLEQEEQDQLNQDTR